MSMATEATILSEANGVSFTSKQEAAAVMVSMVTSSVRGATSLGVEAWLVSVSYVTGADKEELHGEEGQQESQEQLELQERYKHIINLNLHKHEQLSLLTLHRWSCNSSTTKIKHKFSSITVGSSSSCDNSLNDMSSILPVALEALSPVIRAERGWTIAEWSVQQRAMLREQVGVCGTRGLWVAWSGEHRAVGWRRGGGLSRHFLIGRQLQRCQET